MEEEEQQLLDRLQREQAERRGDSAFQHLLVEASKMRESQDEEIRLEGQQKQQLQSLAMTKQRLKQARRILDVIAACEGKPIGSIITVLEEESQKSADHLESIIEERHKVETMLLKAEKEAELDKTEHDIEYVMEMAAQLEVMLCEKQGKLDSLPNRDRKLSKLASLKQVSMQQFQFPHIRNSNESGAHTSCSLIPLVGYSRRNNKTECNERRCWYANNIQGVVNVDQPGAVRIYRHVGRRWGMYEHK